MFSQQLYIFRKSNEEQHLTLADFMKHLADHYDCEHPNKLGIVILGLHLPLSVRLPQPTPWFTSTFSFSRLHLLFVLLMGSKAAVLEGCREVAPTLLIQKHFFGDNKKNPFYIFLLITNQSSYSWKSDTPKQPQLLKNLLDIQTELCFCHP